MTGCDSRLPHHTTGLAVWFDQNDYPVRESDRTVRVCLEKNLQTSEDLTVTVTAMESSPASATGRSTQGYLSTSLAHSWTVLLARQTKSQTSIWSSVSSGGKDFSTDPRKITIPAGSEGTACTDIDITDDSVALEGNETFTLTLTVDDHSPPVTSAATVTIIDDDGKLVHLS